MANISVNDLSITVQTNNRIKFTVDFTIVQSTTEAILKIPIHVYAKLMQKKGNVIDSINLYANEKTTIDSIERDSRPLPPGTSEPINPPSGPTTKDVQCSDWKYVGIFADSSTSSYSFSQDINQLPADSDTENWYVALIARPDIISSIAFSDALRLNIGG